MNEQKQVTRQRHAQASVAAQSRPSSRKASGVRAVFTAIVPLLLVLAGCGGSTVSGVSNGTFTISPGAATIDTNCVGCNAKSSSGAPVEKFTVTLNSGGAASVVWSVSGGDAKSGSGTIDAVTGQYTPPSYLTADSVQVTVTAKLSSDPSVSTSTVLNVTPGFLQPLSPENAALGASGTLTLTGYIAEAGGTLEINWSLTSALGSSGGGLGTLGTPACVRGSKTFTHCSVVYSAPSSIGATTSMYVVGTIGASSSKASTVVLLNTAGVSSNPLTHEVQQIAAPVLLGSSGGNNNDYDLSNGQIADCCGGTLGALIQNSSGRQYILSNNHVLARSDQAKVGETIVQPALIDDNCSPFGITGAAISAVGTLSGFVPLKSQTTNVDAAIAQVNSDAINTSGAILELGALQNGTLAAAPPGISSSGGRGESAVLNMIVAKSGRTTGLTCATVSAVNLDVNVDYYTDCAESKPYLTKTYTNQIAISGNQFSDSGDSGSLVVDTFNAEPVGLFFAGGVDSSGVSMGVANPAQEVLNELNTMSGTTYTFVGTTDHAVSCLNYGNTLATSIQSRILTAVQSARAEQAMNQARMLVSPSTGILGVATGKSADQPGDGAVIVYIDPSKNVSVPATVNGVRTLVIPATANAVAFGTAPRTPQGANVAAVLTETVLNDALAIKNQVAQSLMRQNAAFFGVGVGQSMDDPQEAALVIYVDRRSIPAQLPATINGLRTRYVIMDRLHVTRSYASPIQSRSRCSLGSAPRSADFDLPGFKRSHNLGLLF